MSQELPADRPNTTDGDNRDLNQRYQIIFLLTCCLMTIDAASRTIAVDPQFFVCRLCIQLFIGD